MYTLHILHTEEPRNKASANSVIPSIRHVFQSPNFFLLFSLVKHSANKAFGNKVNPPIRHNFSSPLVTFYLAIVHSLSLALSLSLSFSLAFSDAGVCWWV